MNYYLLCFLLISSLCFGKTEKLLDGANPNPLSNYEGLPNSVVAGSVNVITGDYFENADDLTLPLRIPVKISRSYTSSDTFGPSFEEGSFMYGWNLNHGAEITTHHFDNEDSFHNYCQLRSAGMNLKFDHKEKRKKHNYRLAKELFQYGLTNTGKGEISGRTNLKNIRVRHEKRYYIVTDGSGTEKRFERTKEHHYRILSEKRPDESMVKYEYVKNNLKRISVCNSQNEEIAWVNINRPEKMKNKPQIVLESSDNRHIYYDFIDRGGKRYILSGAHRTEGPAELYSYEPLKKRVGHFSRVNERKYANGLTRRIEYHSKPSKLATDAPQSYIDCRVKALYESPHTEPVYTFEYVKPKRKNDFKGQTIVRDAIGREDTYTYDSNLRLTAVESPAKKETYRWSDEGELLQRILEEQKKTITLAVRYHYDKYGNVLNEQIYGCFTGTGNHEIGTDKHGFACGGECYEIKRVYSPDGLNLLIREDNGRNIRTLEYKPGTNLKVKEILWDGNAVRKRHQFSYDKNSAVVEEIVDDGITPRFITRYKNNNIGLPIEEAKYACSPQGEILLSRTVIQYNLRGLILSKQVYNANNEFDHALHFDYDIQGNLIKKVDARGFETTYTYNILNQVIEEIGPDCKKSFTYDLKGRLIAEKIDNQVTRHAYDAMGRKIYTTDPYGNKTTYSHDWNGNVICEKTPSGKEIRTQFDILGNPIVKTDGEGHTIRTKYNIRGRPIRIDYPDGSYEQKTYTLDGLLKTHRFRDGRQIVYTYDYQGRLIKEETPLGEKTWVYDAFNLLSETDPNGNTTYYEYDYANRLIAKRKGSAETLFSYDLNGRIAGERIKTTDDDAIVTRYEYDVHGNAIKESNQQTIIEKSYDSQNRVIEERVGDSITKTEYDPYGRITAKIDPLGHSTRYIYDDQNHETTIIDPLGNITQHHYDIEGNLSTVIRKNIFGEILLRENYEYDGNKNRISMHINGVTTRFTHNWEGNVTSVTEAEGFTEQKITRYSYNDSGQKTQTIKPDGTEISYTYDILGRLKTLRAPGIGYDYEYDLNDNPIKVTSQNGVTFRAYDDHDRILSETLENGLCIQYEYDLAEQLIQLTYPDKSTSKYRYNGDQLTQVFRNQYSCEYLSFDERGNPTEIKQLDHLTHLSYDPVGRMTSISAPAWTCKDIQYDAAGQLTSMTTCDTDYQFTYDDLYQLTSETGAEANQFENDPISNIISVNATSRSNNHLNQLLTHGELEYRYDLNGNLIQTPEMILTYDALDRLIEVRKGEEAITYAYDPWNRRMSKSNGERYLCVGQDDVGTYLDDRCIHLRLLGLGKGAEIGASLAIEIEGTPYAPVHDVSGSIISLINQETYCYNAYGKQLQPGSLQNPWGFAGKRYDPETGFINFGRRYYSPEMMKWVTPDPIGYEDGPNLYAYVHNNPITHFDKYGLLASRIQNNTAAAASGTMWDNFTAGLSHQLNSETFGLMGTDSDDDQRDLGGISYYAGRGAMFVGSFCVPLGWVTKAIKGVKYGGKALSVAGRYFCKASTKLGVVSKGYRSEKIGEKSLDLVYKSWEKGTFPNKMQSIRYHWIKHGKNRSIENYTKDAVNYFDVNKKYAHEVLLKNGKEGFSIKMKNGKLRSGGFWTSDGKIITFWD